MFAFDCAQIVPATAFSLEIICLRLFDWWCRVLVMEDLKEPPLFEKYRFASRDGLGRLAAVRFSAPAAAFVLPLLLSAFGKIDFLSSLLSGLVLAATVFMIFVVLMAAAEKIVEAVGFLVSEVKLMVEKAMRSAYYVKRVFNQVALVLKIEHLPSPPPPAGGLRLSLPPTLAPRLLPTPLAA